MQSNKKYSFQINTFWIHLTMNGNTGTDQFGDRWFLRNGKLYSEFSYHIIPLNKTEESKKKMAIVSADEMFMMERERNRAISFQKYRVHEMNIRSYNAGKVGGVA